MAYKDAWAYQEQLMQFNIEQKILVKKQQSGSLDQTQPACTKNHFLLCEHPAVYTLGRNGNSDNILISEKDLEEKKIELYRTNRGGDITFHGPGQIVGYPILDLEKYSTDISFYLNRLEEIIIRTLAEYGIAAGRSPGETGVWIAPAIKGEARKICAIGIRCSRWITMHGFALNVNTDLGYFDDIIPCGIQDKDVTSIQKEVSGTINMDEVKDKICRHFEDVFESNLLIKVTPPPIAYQAPIH
ncbi:MAG: lipoyl(octanoyl) transferase LipB [Pedobacter sp.]|nr:MAG: lipoyl(octanoyl) transferase LipB [Pedobacter sp.]